MERSLKLLFPLICMLLFQQAFAQDPGRFKTDIEKLVQTEHQFSGDKELVVFAGSSSIRMWKDVQEYFPEYDVINHGFGGSHFSDLIHYYDELILKHIPDYLFVYEGDNDIAGDKSPEEVMRDVRKLHQKLQKDLPHTKIIYISPKPSMARENLKQEYLKLNKRLKKFCRNKPNTRFADVWKAMTDENGKVYQNIFLADGLHMNKKGYDIWGDVISEFLN